jgi:hypothetical protein
MKVVQLLKGVTYLFNTKIKAGNAELIESNSVIALVQDPFENNPNNNNVALKTEPIEIDLYYSEEFLFRLNFIFQNTDGSIGWESKPDKNNQSQNFIINLRHAAGVVATTTAVYVASAGDGSKFYVSFSVAEAGFGTQLTYSIYRVRSSS